MSRSNNMPYGQQPQPQQHQPGMYGRPPPGAAAPQYPPQQQQQPGMYGRPPPGAQQPQYGAPQQAQYPPANNQYPPQQQQQQQGYYGTQQQPQYGGPPPQQYHQQPQQQYPPTQQQQPQQQYPPPQQQPAPAAQPNYSQPAQSNQPTADTRPVAQQQQAAAIHNAGRQAYALPEWVQNIPKVERMNYNETMDAMISAGQTSEEDIQEAKNEHIRKDMPFGAGEDELKDEYGPGTVYFFYFIKFVAVFNLALVVIQAIHWIAWVGRTNPKFESGSDFYITGYTSKDSALWYVMTVLATLLCLGASPIYYRLMKAKIPADDEAEGEADPTDKILRYNNDATIDVGFYYRSPGQYIVRRLASALVFGVLISIQILASYAITQSENSQTNSTSTSLGIALLVSGLNVIYTGIARFMTEFEKWFSYSRWKKSLTVKLILFKLANILTVYAAKDYNNLGESNCTYNVIGEQFFWLLLTEIILMNIWEICFALLHAKYFQTYARLYGSITGDYDNMPQFDLSLEYLEVIYRQYLAILAMVVFPVSIVISTIGFLIEFFVDKWKLYRICGKPRYMSQSQKEFLALNLALISVVTLFTPYAGTIWVTAGWTKEQSPLCNFP